MSGMPSISRLPDTTPLVTLCVRPCGLPSTTTSRPGLGSRGVAEMERLQILRRRREPRPNRHGDPMRARPGTELAAIGRLHGEPSSFADHMQVGGDQAVGADDEAGAEAVLATVASRAANDDDRRQRPLHERFDRFILSSAGFAWALAGGFAAASFGFSAVVLGGDGRGCYRERGQKQPSQTIAHMPESPSKRARWQARTLLRYPPSKLNRPTPRRIRESLRTPPRMTSTHAARWIYRSRHHGPAHGQEHRQGRLSARPSTHAATMRLASW